uniref:O-antigen ligase-related domain-containing protein n=1 Tax=Eiseniibacteriota bacterium TaxID=2212470 RepID=A0A832I5G4_UNCEI
MDPMTTATSPLAGARGPSWGPAAAATAGVGFALLVGLTAGSEVAVARVMLVLATGGVAIAMVLRWPVLGFHALAASSVLLVAVTLIGSRAVNAFDVLLVPALAVTWWRTARSASRPAAGESGAEAEINIARSRLVRATLAYLVLAGLSLGMTVLLGRLDGAVQSALSLVRAVQGVLLFPLAMAWLRDGRSLKRAVAALLTGGAGFALVNALAVGSGSVARAGLTWYANEPLWSVADPNEAGTAMLLLWVLLLSWHATRPRWWHLPALGVALFMLVLTQSRSGLLAWLVFTALSLKPGQRRYAMLFPLLALAALPLVPTTYWERLTRTLLFERGSFEAFSSFIRVYGWQIAVQMFLDHPMFGVGYLGFRHFADRYSDLGLVLGQAESMYLETAAGMGLIGLWAFGVALRRLWCLADPVRRHAPPGSFAARLAAFHRPYVAGLLAALITSSHLVGMVGLAQIALWSALLVRAGRMAAAGDPDA